MVQRAIWQDIYLAETKSSFAGDAIDSAAKTFIAGGIGSAANIYALPLTEHPNFASGMNALKSEKMAGILVNQAENYAVGSNLPTVTYSLDLDVRVFGFFGWLFFQTGAEELSAHPFKQKIFTIPNSSTCEVWSTLCRVQSSNVAMSEIIDGAVCKGLTLSGEEGQTLSLSLDMAGRTYTNDFNLGGQSSILDFPESQICLFKDVTITAAGYTINFLQSFEMKLDNGAMARYYNGSSPYEYRLKKMTGTFTFTVPLDENTKLLKAVSMNTPSIIFLTIGGGVAPLPPVLMSITFGGVFLEPASTGQDEVQLRLRVDLNTLIGDAGSPIVILCNDNVSRGIL